MGLLTKLKSLLGFEDDRSQVRRGESGVTIERDPDESTETDSAVEAGDAGAEESFDAGGTATDGEAGAEPGSATTSGSATTDPDEPVESETTATTTPEGIEEVGSEPEVDEEPVDSGVDADDAGAEATGTDEATTGDAETGTADLEGDEREADASATDDSDAAVDADETGESDAATDPESAVEEAVEAAAEAAAGAGEPLEDVKGIGSAYAERLRNAGVDDVADLATADADRLAEETDLSPKRISTWIERAQAR